MCTLGAGISPACREDVQLIWSSLAASFDHMEEAIRHLRRVEEHIAVLSTYLGHISPADTYWYLSASPELMALAAERLDARFGAR